jgi:hypothetical protein
VEFEVHAGAVASWPWIPVALAERHHVQGIIELRVTGQLVAAASAAKFKAFTGLTPKASETGETDRKGQAITKAGAARLGKQLICSANTARQVDPQLAAVYHAQMVERGAHHTKALCVVAGRLAERFWTVQASG